MSIFWAVGGACVDDDGGWFSSSDCCGLLALRGVECSDCAASSGCGYCTTDLRTDERDAAE